MIRRRVLTVGLSVALIGLLVAVSAGERGGQISLRVWLTSIATCLVAAAAIRLLTVVDLETPRPMSFRSTPLRRRRAGRWRGSYGLRSVERLVLDACRRPRIHVTRLRPRLAALAHHHLPRTHGIDPATEPERVAQLLGPEAWLLDPTVTDRVPTPAEVGRLLDTVVPHVDSHPTTHDGRGADRGG